VTTVYSVGYEGLSAQSFTTLITRAHVEVVVDVRLNAVSRRPGFSKRRLAEALSEAGVGYVHEPELGNPPENRASFRSGTDDAGRQRLRRRLATADAGQALQRVADRAREQTIAVMCVEHDHHRCHRALVVEALTERLPGLELHALP
jgi:uncharacterized protein (DUF488 family)